MHRTENLYRNALVEKDENMIIQTSETGLDSYNKRKGLLWGRKAQFRDAGTMGNRSSVMEDRHIEAVKIGTRRNVATTVRKDWLMRRRTIRNTVDALRRERRRTRTSLIKNGDLMTRRGGSEDVLENVRKNKAQNNSFLT